MTAYPANAGELIHVPLRNSRIDVEATYVQIASSDPATRRDLYSPLTVQMKEDLWTVQLEHFINQHPELDQEQRSVVYEALGLLAAGVLEQDSAAQDFATRTSHLQQRAGAVFSRSWVEAAFVKLGAPETPMTMLRSGNNTDESRASIEPARHISWLCDCNTDPQQDFCGGLTGPEHCIGGKRVCTFTTGCGWWWSYGCDGYCSG
jgi:hypothetical protein